jgi:hypothetical protein
MESTKDNMETTSTTKQPVESVSGDKVYLSLQHQVSIPVGKNNGSMIPWSESLMLVSTEDGLKVVDLSIGTVIMTITTSGKVFTIRIFGSLLILTFFQKETKMLKNLTFCATFCALNNVFLSREIIS